MTIEQRPHATYLNNETVNIIVSQALEGTTLSPDSRTWTLQLLSQLLNAFDQNQLNDSLMRLVAENRSAIKEYIEN